MNRSELQQFAQQLSLWTELIIENGRTPFRRVDLYPEIHTDQGLLQPPLVFWINRQSMMAGGILLLPEQNLKAELEYGASCCTALGLKHFVTWESDRVRIWQKDDDGIQQHRQFDFTHADHPDSFRHLLGEVLETLKLLAVIGLVPPAELSPHYLHNLFQTTLDLTLPALVNSYRSLRAEEELSTAADADQLANEANRLLLLQLLGLIWHRQLPSAILPEKLERAIQLSLPQLPEPLKQTMSLSATTTPAPLPHDAAVCFHHLLLRLRQLSWRESEQRAITSIQQLVASWQTDLPGQLPEGDVQLYPQSPILGEATQLILSDSPSLLAAAGLMQDLLQQPPKLLICGTLFQLDFSGRSHRSICGRLNKSRPLTRNERHQYTTLLRTSWPNRRFRIGSDKPLWFWELIHLLGLSKEQQKLQLILPLTALKSQVTEPFWPLLLENYSIQQVSLLTDEIIFLELFPTAGLEIPIKLMLGDETRTLSIANEMSLVRSQLLLALLLPKEIYQMLGNQLVWPSDEELDNKAQAGMRIYMKSRLWRLFEEITGPNLQSDPEAIQPQQLVSWPRPDFLHLKELARAEKQQATDPDRLLAELLQTPELNSIAIQSDEQNRTTAIPRVSDKDLQIELAQQLQREGIPTFPEQYLYFLDSPDMTCYRLTPPLTVTSELLGEIELVDAAGQTLRVYGEELANALLLCSKLKKTEVELPVDRHQLALLQQQYWNDLKQLHKQLNSLCHSRLKSPNAADKLAKKVWKRLQLPKLK